MILPRALILGALCLLLSNTASSNGAEKLRVAYPTLGPGSTPSWVTHETGFWKKSGLDVELILLSGGARMLPALIRIRASLWRIFRAPIWCASA